MDTTAGELSPLIPDRTSGSPATRLRTSSLRKTKSSRSDIGPNYHERERSNGPEILSPRPRRHLLESRELNEHWLPSSPTSSRAVSPTTSTYSSRKVPRHKNLSTMFEELDGKTPRGDSRGSTVPEKRSSRIIQSHMHEGGKAHEENSMARRWCRWMHERGLDSYVVPTSIIASTWIKYCVGLGGYSGYNTPPMFGDYEAQRHWMELTVHLPIRQWYTYDLQYWGLDYPPITAYVSWLCGVVGSWINPAWFELDGSRGIETEGSKLFMRFSVLFFDLLVYVPALYLFTRTWQGTRSKRTQNTALLLLLLHPALLLIDFGHFQYNSVMLGLTLFAINFFARGQDLLGAIFFVLSLGFKQMALYYAPAVGSYLLAKCIWLGKIQGRTLFIQLGVTTLATFALVFLPFLPPFSGMGGLRDPITRIFPFARGLFEDKVANFWCATNVVFKWRNVFSSTALIRVSTGLTGLGFLPSSLVLLNAGWKLPALSGDDKQETRGTISYTPILPLLPYALLASSMSFFLFSFQVHEKTILLPLLPITLHLSGASPDSTVYAWGVLVNNVACFSMWPLLQRDGLGIQYVALLLLWNRLIGYNLFRLRISSFVGLLSLLVYTAMIAVQVTELIFPPPARYPDIYPVLNVLISMPVFAATWLWSNKCMLEVSWAIGAFGSREKKSTAKSASDGGAIHGQIEPTSGTSTVSRPLGQRAMSLGYSETRKRKTSRSVAEMSKQL